MTYNDGQIVRVGDEVELWSGERGVVVLSIDTQEETPEFLLNEWKCLKDGVLVKTTRGVLVAFHDEADEDFHKV